MLIRVKEAVFSQFLPTLGTSVPTSSRQKRPYLKQTHTHTQKRIFNKPLCNYKQSTAVISLFRKKNAEGGGNIQFSPTQAPSRLPSCCCRLIFQLQKVAGQRKQARISVSEDLLSPPGVKNPHKDFIRSEAKSCLN